MEKVDVTFFIKSKCWRFTCIKLSSQSTSWSARSCKKSLNASHCSIYPHAWDQRSISWSLLCACGGGDSARVEARGHSRSPWKMYFGKKYLAKCAQQCSDACLLKRTKQVLTRSGLGQKQIGAGLWLCVITFQESTNTQVRSTTQIKKRPMSLRWRKKMDGWK